MHERLGRYELLRPIGEGGSARVYEARLNGPLGFCKVVALKILSTHVGGDRFREARMGAQLQHPNVVATYAVEELEGTCCIAMEFVRGGSARRLVEGGSMSDRAVVELGLQVLDGLQHIHEHGLVHRDIKPANLLVTEGGNVKITDLGIAHPVGASQRASGTYGYLPAEQCEGQATPLSDLFALGVTLFRLRTGERLFPSGPMALVHAARADAYLDETDRLALIQHSGLRGFIACCVRQSADERYPSAAAARTALAALIGPGLTGGSLLELLDDEVHPKRTELPAEVAVEGEELFGRTGLLVRLLQSLQRLRWLTLEGVDGVGKSSVARALAGRVEGAVWIDVDGADSLNALAVALAFALDVPVSRAESGDIGEVLCGFDGVVFIDHVDGICGWQEAIAAALSRTEATVVCVSSGARPRHPREGRMCVTPLTPAAAMDLFCARSGVSSVDVERVAEFQGIPLAIELGAARFHTGRTEVTASDVHPEVVREETVSADQASLILALSATWKRLPRWGRVALAQLASFVEGFTVRSAAGVLDVDGPPVLEVLERLQKAGVLRFDPKIRRFYLSRHVRSFARTSDPDAAAIGRQRHGEWFAQLGVPSTLVALQHPDNKALRDEVIAELRNIEEAVHRAVADGNADLAHNAALAAAWVFLYRGPTPAGAQILMLVEGLEGPRLPAVLVRRAYFASLVGDHRTALALTARGRELARSYNLPDLEIRADLRIGQVLIAMGEHSDARTPIERALQRATEKEDVLHQALALFLLGSIYTWRGQMPLAFETMESCAVLFQSCSSWNSEVVALINMGLIQTALGADSQALEALETARGLAVRMGNERRRLSTTLWLAEVHLRSMDEEAAERELKVALPLLGALGDMQMNGRSEAIRGGLALLQGQPAIALPFLQNAVELLDPIAIQESHVNRIELVEAHLLLGQWEEARQEIKVALSGLMGTRWHREIAHLLCQRARAMRNPTDVERARGLLKGIQYHPRIDRAIATAVHQLSS